MHPWQVAMEWAEVTRGFILCWPKGTDAGGEEVYLGLCGKSGSQLAPGSPDLIKTALPLLLLIHVRSVTEHGECPLPLYAERRVIPSLHLPGDYFKFIDFN